VVYPVGRAGGQSDRSGAPCRLACPP
jgi:hypothetical protein